jgi:hypothetical protein
MKSIFLSLVVASLIGAVPALAKDGVNGKATAPGQLKKIHSVPDTGSTLALLGISFVTLVAFGRGLRVNATDGVK